MFLRFVSPYSTGKVYAETPMGEYAYADRQGLYEWRNGERIDHSGGDKQISSNGQLWIAGLPCKTGPKTRGIQEALRRARLN